MLKRVLFVDDEPNVLDGLRRMLRPLRQEWDMAFASNGPEALEVLGTTAFDVIVTDMRMPGMDGAELLAHVRGRHPRVVRIVLTGQSSREAVLRAINVAHRQLTKPCEPEALKAAVRRACALRDLLSNPTLLTLLSRLESIPSMPAMYAEVVRELESVEPSLKKVGDIIARDVGMSAKILQIIHSAFFGVRFHVSSPAQAVIHLGAETTKFLVLGANIFCRHNPEALRPFSIDALFAHSQHVSRLAGEIARAEGCRQKDVEYACMAGLLHDTGKLVLAGYLPDQYKDVLALEGERELLPCDAEREVFGTTHAEVGAYLLGLWGLPDPIVEAIAWHHHPAECPTNSFGPLAAVHVADALADEGPACEGGGGRLDRAFIERLGAGARIAVWRTFLDPQSRPGGES